ncbi:transposase domain-containing protein [Pseudophaeobacter sp.]|uniref:transposase domain-containing protein n=1 Tax=Pseudophaeobacter sp. TaxID=1971739 RepID=UPI003297C6BC
MVGLAEARFPGLPGTARGVNIFAMREGWRGARGAIMRKPGRGGGLFYHWSVLPFNARLKLIERDAVSQADHPEASRDRSQAWAGYEQLNQKSKDAAAERLDALNKVELLHLSGATHVVAVEVIAKEKDVSARTVYNWLAMVEGVEDADRLAYLAPRPPKKRVKKEDRAQYLPFMDWLQSAFLRLEQPTFAQSYRAATREAKRQGWDYPILKTAKRWVDAEVSRTTQVFKRQGMNGLMRCFPAQIRDRSSLSALEAVNADCHKIDVFVKWPDGTVNRPQIVVFQDLYSNKFLSWRVDHDPNKVMVMAAFGEMVDKWGIPKRCLFDNGHEFANKWMTAGAPTRFRFKVRETDPVGVLPLLGIKMHWATPAHGQAKPIERGFRDIASDVAKDPRFAGAYVGNRPEAKPENYGSRAIPLEEFLEVLEEGFEEHNARTGRRSDTANGRSFDETFAESYAKTTRPRATEEQRNLWLMGQDTKKLHKQNGSLTFHKNIYHCAWMSQEANKNVVVRFDPEDLHSGVHTRFMGRLRKHGIIREWSRSQGKIFYTAKQPEALRDQAKAERASDEGAIWTAIRHQKKFRPVDLFAALSPARPDITQGDILSYCRVLRTAGYLRASARTRSRKMSPDTSLILTRNTGPLPPQQKRMTVVIDSNEDKIIYASGGRLQ